MQIVRAERFSPKLRQGFKPLGYLIIALLLVADFAFANAGLPILAPVSATITVPGTWILLAFAASGLLVQILRQPIPVASRRAVSVGTWLVAAIGIASGSYLTIVHGARPVAEKQAFDKLANAIVNPRLLEFDPRLSEADRLLVIQSKPSAWRLFFSSPMFIGYDFNLPTGDGRYVGARVTPSTMWRSTENIWVFPEVSRSMEHSPQ